MRLYIRREETRVIEDSHSYFLPVKNFTRINSPLPSAAKITGNREIFDAIHYSGSSQTRAWFIEIIFLGNEASRDKNLFHRVDFARKPPRNRTRFSASYFINRSSTFADITTRE